jgi:DNA-directed RNA polymerase specialized sigma24 family protein
MIMEFNYGLEKKRFEGKWNRLEVEYREAGMREDAIEEMKAFDWEAFKRERIFCKHNQFYQGHRFANDDEIEDGKDPLLEKYFYSFITEDNYFGERRYGWIEQLDDEELIIAVKSMKIEHIEIITRYVYEEETQAEIAESLDITQQVVSRYLERIRKNIKKF